MMHVEAQPSQPTATDLNPLIRPLLMLRAEGLALLAVSVAAYVIAGGHWGYLFLGFLADLTFVGYLVSPKLGATLYNLVHTTVVPLSLIAAGYFAGYELVLFAGLIMLTHVGLDRTAGYGLKYPDAFKHTHLDW